MFRKHDAFWVTLVKLAQYIRDLFPHKEFVGPISSSSNIKGTRDLYKSSRCIHPSCIVIIITFRGGGALWVPLPPPYMSLVLRLEQDLDRCSVRAGGQREGSLLQRAGGRSTRRIATRASSVTKDPYSSWRPPNLHLSKLSRHFLFLFLNVHGRNYFIWLNLILTLNL